MNGRSGSATRTVILDAAIRVFAENGYHGCTMRMIASEAGISVGALYLYFKSKEELFLTLMTDWMAELERTTAQVLNGLDDPAEELRRFIRTSVVFAMEHREMILLQGKETGCSFGLESKRSYFASRRKMIERIITRGVERGIFRQCDAADVANVVFCALRGYVMSLMLADDALFEPSTCAELMLTGLQQPQ